MDPGPHPETLYPTDLYFLPALRGVRCCWSGVHTEPQGPAGSLPPGAPLDHPAHMLGCFHGVPATSLYPGHSPVSRPLPWPDPPPGFSLEAHLAPEWMCGRKWADAVT